jgi:SAM-dependent methyltransferase
VDDRDRRRLRATFDEVAELYDRARPGYPARLLDDLAALADLGPGSRVLEIGPGTGKLTVPLAERGYQVVAVELGAELAAVARRNLAGLPDVQVVVAGFEDWALPEEPFDAVVAASAWHWLDPAVRATKAAAALRPAGTLAVIATHHVRGGDHGFFDQVQRCYERWDPDTPPGLRLPAAADVTTSWPELDDHDRFTATSTRRYEWDQRYSTGAYLELLRTFSGHRAMAPGARRGLLACIARLLDDVYGGQIVKRYLIELQVAHAVGRP